MDVAEPTVDHAKAARLSLAVQIVRSATGWLEESTSLCAINAASSRSEMESGGKHILMRSQRREFEIRNGERSPRVHARHQPVCVTRCQGKAATTRAAVTRLRITRRPYRAGKRRTPQCTREWLAPTGVNAWGAWTASPRWRESQPPYPTLSE